MRIRTECASVGAREFRVGAVRAVNWWGRDTRACICDAAQIKLSHTQNAHMRPVSCARTDYVCSTVLARTQTPQIDRNVKKESNDVDGHANGCCTITLHSYKIHISPITRRSFVCFPATIDEWEKYGDNCEQRSFCHSPNQWQNTVFDQTFYSRVWKQTHRCKCNAHNRSAR